MPTARAFAYNPFETIPPGCTQYGNLAIQDTGWAVGAGGLHWYNGPDEEPGYVIAYVANPPKTAATYTENITSMSVGFRRTSTLDAVEFLNLAEQVTGQVFTGAQDAQNWLLSNGYWTSFGLQQVGLVVDGLTLRLDSTIGDSYPGSGTTWYDLAGTSQDITLTTFGVTYVISGSIYEPNYLNFDGTGYGLGTLPVISSTQYTKSVWFNRTGQFTEGNLVSSEDGGHFMWFGPDAENSNLFCGHTDWDSYTVNASSINISLNTWYCATVTFDTTEGMKLYINGQLDTTFNSILTPVPGNLSTNIGVFGGANTFTGKISKVYCYNRVLSDIEVQQNFDFDKAEFGY